jgi:general secretion pathway protein N
MKRTLVYSLLGIAAFLFFIATLAPATLLTEPLRTRLPGLSLQAVEGTAIAGAMVGAQWRDVRAERFLWRWRPLALLLGRLEANLNLEDSEAKLSGNAAMGFSRQLRFVDLTGQLPLNWVAALAGVKNSPLEGIVELNLADLSLNAAGQPLSAQGTIRLSKLRVNLGRPLVLGDYSLQVDSTSKVGIQAKIKDNNAPLLLDGIATLSTDGRYQLTGHAALRDPANQSLRQVLSLLGPPGNDGRWPLNFSGAVPR